MNLQKTGQPAKRTVPLGWYVVGGVGAISLADTEVGPVVVAGLIAAVVVNAVYILK